jgi:glycosyltransferase involved in cell wall biosynthesis
VVAEIKRLQRLGRRVEWWWHVDETTLRQAYEDCAFTVFPSLVEGFGLPIIESLWHCRPCICGGNGALGEVARGGGCLIVDQRDPAALAGAIQSLLKDRDLCGKLCAEAALRTFRTWDDYIVWVADFTEMAVAA